MGGAAADDFRRKNYIIADIVVYLENLAFRNFQDEDLPPVVSRVIGKRGMLEGKAAQSQQGYHGPNGRVPKGVPNKRQVKLRGGK